MNEEGKYKEHIKNILWKQITKRITNKKLVVLFLIREIRICECIISKKLG